MVQPDAGGGGDRRETEATDGGQHRCGSIHPAFQSVSDNNVTLKNYVFIVLCRPTDCAVVVYE